MHHQRQSPGQAGLQVQHWLLLLAEAETCQVRRRLAVQRGGEPRTSCRHRRAYGATRAPLPKLQWYVMPLCYAVVTEGNSDLSQSLGTCPRIVLRTKWSSKLNLTSSAIIAKRKGIAFVIVRSRALIETPARTAVNRVIALTIAPRSVLPRTSSVGSATKVSLRTVFLTTRN